MLSSNQSILLDEIISIKKTKPHTELEARITKNISVEQFRRLAKFLKRAGYHRQEEPEVLDINFYANERKDQNMSIRYSIVGLDNIRNYCKIERPVQYVSMYKSRIQWPQSILDKYPSEHFSHNSIYINIQDFDYRINLKSEVLPDENGKFQDRDADRAYSELQELVERVGYDNIFKTFRFKKRTSFTTNDGQFRIDLTMIKNSKKTISFSGSEDLFLTKSFKESNTLNEKEFYEVEIEYIGKETENIKKDLIKQMDLVHTILFSKTNTSMSNSTQQQIKVEYCSLMKKMLINFTKIQIKEIEEYAKGERYPSNRYNLQNNFPSRLENVDPSNLMKNHLYRSLVNKITEINEMPNDDNKLFFIPKVISMGLENLQPDFSVNIRNNYTVTDKTDGETMILYCSNSANTSIYLIDSNMNVYPVIQSDKPLGEWNKIAGSIVVGEFVQKKKHSEQSPDDDERLIPGFYTFDIYVNNNNDTRMLPLVTMNPEQRSRIQIAESVIRKINAIGNLNCEFYVKRFYVAENQSDNTEIFKLTKQIWDKKDTPEFTYDLDGVIYTPADMPVGFDSSRWYWATQMSSRWVYNMKWKPAEDNTIDFLVSIEKEEIEVDKSKNIYVQRDKIRYKTVITNEKVDLIPYKTVHLYCGYRANYNGNPCIKNTDSKNPRDMVKYVSTKFTPTNPYEPLAYIANIFLDKNNNMLGTRDQCRILDNTIVEFGFDIEKYTSAKSDEERAELWIPLRTRIDKTESYHKSLSDKERIFRLFEKYMNSTYSRGYRWRPNEVFELKMLKLILDKFRLHATPIPRDDSDPTYIYSTLTGFENKKILKNIIKNSLDIPVPILFGNDFEIANAIWNSIHNPITVSIITTGQNIRPLRDTEEVYYNRDTNIARDKSITFELQEFHNKFVKNKELYHVATQMLKDSGTSDIYLLDLACGKGGDLHKWNNNNIKRVVGIDINSNNIYDPKDGACVRYNEFSKKMETFHITSNLEQVDFLYGDVSLNIKTSECMKSEHSRELQQELWKVYDKRGFDLISIQFALHYLFESESKLDGFLRNVSENLRAGGLFIGTCFDGNQVYERLKSLNSGESISGESDGITIYKIKKLYENIGETIPNDSRSIGLPIEVYIQSINQSIREYLVSYDVLVKKMAEIHLYPVKTSLFDEIYHKYKTEFPKLTSLKQQHKDLSFLNRCFIFKKGESMEIQVEDIYRNIMSMRANPDVNKALSHGLKQKNWDTLKSLLQNLDIKMSEANFVQLTQKLTSEKATIVLEPLRKKKPILQGLASEESVAKGPESLSTVSKTDEPGGKAVEPTVKQPMQPTMTGLDKFNKNFEKIELKIMELRKGKFSKDALQAWLTHLELVRTLYKPEFNMDGKIKELDITIEIVKERLKA